MASDLPALVDTYAKNAPVAEARLGEFTLRYHVPNSMCLARVQTLLTKEPDTIGWLYSIPTGATLLDVGANVGMYSVFAAVIRGARVFAFEPEAQNFAVLCRNIVANNLSGRLDAWCAAVSDKSGFDRIYLSNVNAGGSCHSFGEEVDFHLRPSAPRFAQGSYATTVDELVGTGVIEVPAFIKIDVDGFDHKVIHGAQTTLRDRRVQSVIVELNTHLAEHRDVVGLMSSLGFTYDAEQVTRAQRKEGAFKGIGEHVFRR
jgi:FkbM family methyltransferase